MFWAAHYRKLQLKLELSLKGLSHKNIVYVIKTWMHMVWGLDQQPQILGHLVDVSLPQHKHHVSRPQN